ncbi:MAG: NUDIX domain-containing protein [bacterium]|nr:NUDIX domain-containing protein [bacterium]
MVEQRKWNVTFLVDSPSVHKVVVLRRAADKSYAPNLCTGIGGKLEPGENSLDSAYRELEEEAAITKNDIQLSEFARCIYDNGLTLYYFWGILNRSPLPTSADGTLYWVSTDKLLEQDFIPTTRSVCEEWAKRNFRVDKPFTVFVHQTGQEKGIRLFDVQRVTDGLANPN